MKIQQTVPLYQPFKKDRNKITLYEAEYGFFIERPVVFSFKKMYNKTAFIKFFKENSIKEPTFFNISQHLYLVHDYIIIKYTNDSLYTILYAITIPKNNLNDYIENKQYPVFFFNLFGETNKQRDNMRKKILKMFPNALASWKENMFESPYKNLRIDKHANLHNELLQQLQERM